MSSPNIEIKKNKIERNIDCRIWYIKNGVTCFLITAAIISHINPTPPAVKYVAADNILSIGYICLEGCNDIVLSVIFYKVF